jgi:hypothetical protein
MTPQGPYIRKKEKRKNGKIGKTGKTEKVEKLGNPFPIACIG